ncbi:hypothetical protein MLD38_039030 [Melastoma candidum]|uniref:Uncharacterized protein n=2 Tax=Melastoma candidum TaxID=119954 RepID=A0ACB9L1G8_9MYRT|nr:hypothetical protein MLD38_039030 [Melastoma candidum]
MDSYPQMRPHMHWYPQDSDALPPQMGFDPTKFPMVQGPWPYSAHAYPMPCNGCGYQMNFPGYYHHSPPPHPNFYHPQPCYSWGSHPGFFDPHPACHGQTMPAASHTMMDHPAFEGKSAAQFHHCCGCPNHVCNPKGRSGVKIEEHEPNLEKNDRYHSDGSSSLIPSSFKNYPYPIMWIPPHFMRNKEQSQGRPSRTDLDDACDEAKPKPAGRSLLEKPKLNEWFPLDMHKRNPFIAPLDLAREPSGQKEDEGRNFQFPVIWVPSWDKQNEVGKEKTDPLLSSSTMVPFAGATDSSKNAQLQSKDQDDASAHLPDMCSTVNKNVASAAESNREKEATKEKNTQSLGRKLSSSPTKSSKLPPVCLRVDPLPRKKNSSDNPRSINSKEAERKGKHPSDNKVHADSRNRGERDVLARDMNERKEDKHYEKKVKVIEVTSGDSSETKDHEMGDAADLNKFHVNEKEIAASQHSDGNLTEKGLKTSAAGDLNFENRMEEKIAKRAFSNSEAATLIQAAYRGYEVRRWHMLQKLKQMAAVREGLIKIRDSVEELKSSNDSLCDTSSFERQKVVIGESIMSLLLKLDTIQGVHPSLRDVRKSLARELVGLQEEIDSLTCKSSNAPKEEDGAVQSACEANHTLESSIVEVDDMGPSSSTEPPRLTQEAKHEEPNELEQGQLQNSKDNSAADMSPEHLNSEETCLVTQQNVDLEGPSVQGKEGNNGISCQQVVDSVKIPSSESADNSQLDKMGDVPINVPSFGAAAALQKEEAVMLAEEIEIPWSTNPVDHSEAIGQGNVAVPDGSINNGEINVEKEEDDGRTLDAEEDDGRTLDAVVEPGAEVGFCDQTTLRDHVGVEKASLEEYGAEAHGVDREADSSPAASVSVAPPSAVPGDIVAENQQHEEDTDAVSDHGNSVPLLLVADDKVPENHPPVGETFPALCGEDVKANTTPGNEIISGTAEAGGDDGEARANIHPGHKPEEEAKPGQGEIRMKTSADDASQVAVVGGIEEDVEVERSIPEGEEMVKDSEDGEETMGLEKQAQEAAAEGNIHPDAREVEVAGEVNRSSKNGMEENERLRLMMERLMEVGKEQIDAIAKLTGRVKDLEGKLARSKKSRARRRCRTGTALPRIANAKSC